MYVEDIYEYILKQLCSCDKWNNNKIDSNHLKIKIFAIEYIVIDAWKKKLTI